MELNGISCNLLRQLTPAVERRKEARSCLVKQKKIVLYLQLFTFCHVNFGVSKKRSPKIA